METRITRPEPAAADRAPTGAQRLRPVTGNRSPRKCDCGCNRGIPCVSPECHLESNANFEAAFNSMRGEAFRAA